MSHKSITLISDPDTDVAQNNKIVRWSSSVDQKTTNNHSSLEILDVAAMREGLVESLISQCQNSFY